MLICTVALFHEPQHLRHDDRRRCRPQHRTDDRGIDVGQAQTGRSQDDRTNDLKRRRHEAQHDRRAADLFHVADIETQTCTEQDNDERDLTKFGRDRQDLRIQKIERSRSQDDTCDNQSQKRRYM